MVTPTVGTEFPEANLVEMLNAPNSDELLRDLAITSKYTNTPYEKTELTHVSLYYHDAESSSSAARIT